MTECIFCKIIKKEIPKDVEYEDEKVISFKDIHPKAPVHFLIVSKKHIASVNHLEKEDQELVGNLFLVGKTIAREKNLKGYKLVVNVGREGGQMIDHLHLHLLGGWRSAEEREVPGMP